MSDKAENQERGDGSLHVFSTVLSAKGQDRLDLIIIERRIDGWEKPGFDFHSIVWERRDGEAWTEVRRITQEDIERGIDVDRWISKLDSFNPVDGSAIVQIGETDRPQGEGSCSVTYSWRLWDLGTNQQIRRFYDCTLDELFDPFDPNKSSEQGGAPNP